MSYLITNTAYRIDGHEAETILCKCPDTNGVKFLQDFQSRLCVEVEFKTYSDILSFLDTQFPGETKMVIANDGIFHPLSEGDRTLEFFGNIKEV